MNDNGASKQQAHLVIGGELVELSQTEFRDLAAVDIVGIFPSYADAVAAWRSAAQRTVDNAAMRYFVINLSPVLAQAAMGKA